MASVQAGAREVPQFPLFNAPNAFVDALRTNGIYALISANASVSAVGQYSMAMRLVQAPIAVIGAAISPVFMQLMASAAPGTLRRLVVSFLVRIALVGLLPFTILGLAAPSVVPWILGPEWADAGLIAQALTPWLYVNLVTSPTATLFAVTERQEVLLGFAIAYAVVPLVPLWLLGSNLLAAVWAMSAVMTLMLIAFLILALAVAGQHDQRSANKTAQNE